MKKILCVILSLISIFSLAACGGSSDLIIEYENPLPWASALHYEKSVYNITKYTRTQSGKEYVDDEVVANGIYTTEINSTDNGETYVYKTTFTLTYVDGEVAKTTDAYGTVIDNRGLTDTMISEVRFKHMSPSYSTKTFTVAARPKDTPQLSGYHYTVDYNTLKANINFGGTYVVKDNVFVSMQGGETKEIALDAGTKIDNEQLMLAVRAMKGVAAGGAPSFYNNNPFDMFVTDSYVRYNMQANCDKELLTTKLSDKINNGNFLINTKEGALKPNDDNSYSVPCVQVSVHKNDSLSGPDTKMLVTDAYYSFAERINIPDGQETTTIITSKLVAEMRHIEYNIPKAHESYNTVYKLDSYTTRK